MGLSYEESIEYLDTLYRLPFLPSSTVGLRRAAFLLDQLGNPHRSFRSVHVAGSTGKGSTTTMIGAILEEAGYLTGYFRSPHLVSYTERVSVDGRDIAPQDWAQHMERIIPVAEGMRNGTYPQYDLGRPTLFEILFALASLHFAEAGVEWAVMEAGLGGRLDATNLLESDISVITNISLEHTQILGRTVSAIAAEKSAIIKPGTIAVTAAADSEALDVIERRARAVGASLLVVGRDVILSASPTGREIRLGNGTLTVTVHRGPDAAYQQLNLAAAFAAAVALRGRGLTIEDGAIVRGLERARIPGRFECIPGTSPVILDGAHNPAGMRALSASLRAQGMKGLVLLFAAMDDKDIESMAETMHGLVDEVVVTRVPGSDRSASVQRSAEAFRAAGIAVQAIDDPAAALDRARDLSRRRTLAVAGSLYLVGEARARLLGVAP